MTREQLVELLKRAEGPTEHLLIWVASFDPPWTFVTIAFVCFPWLVIGVWGLVKMVIS